MATEISEVFFAAAMIDSVATVKDALKTDTNLRQYYKTVVGHIKNSVVFPDEAKRKEYLSLIELKPEKGNNSAKSDNVKVLANMVQGMSAALGFREELSRTNAPVSKRTPRVFLTGNKWPKEIDIFRVEIDNWKDYNSTDVMITFDGKMYYGVSLKKKMNPQAGDPTLINKSFEVMIESRSFDDVRQQLIDAKKNYLTDIVIAAVNSGVINPRDVNKTSTGKCKSLSEFNSWVKTPAGRKEVLESKFIDKKLFFKPGKTGGSAKYINVKGSPGNYWDVSKGDMKKEGSTRYFVNKALSDRQNGLFAEYIKIMNSKAQIFGEALLSIILKTKLENVLRGKGSPILGKYDFGFYLATGIGSYNSNGDITYSVGEVKSLKTIICGLSRIKKTKLKSPYQITLRKKILKKKEEDGDEVESEATKVYLSLISGKTEILDLELRFKGDFMSSPQFQATINSSFNNLLHRECAE
jgi:hypothetical protein